MAEQYKEIKNSLSQLVAVIRLSDGATIPANTENKDYREYLAWVAAGGIVIPADPLPTPAEITALLRTQAINIMNLNTDAQAKILRAILLVIMDELNILRALHSLAPRVASQIKTAVQAKINSGDSD
jgi:hypothetical protein